MAIKQKKVEQINESPIGKLLMEKNFNCVLTEKKTYPSEIRAPTAKKTWKIFYFSTAR